MRKSLEKVAEFIRKDLENFSLESFLGSLHNAAIIGLALYAILFLPK